MALGQIHSIALAADGTVYTWGYNGRGQLGDNTGTNRNTPVKVLGEGGSGNLVLADLTAPTITSVSLAADNSTITVTFSEAVYTTTGASGALTASDFTFSISGGTATLSSTTPSSISASGNTYTLGIALSGTTDGSETLTVNPASSAAIYDGADNAAAASQSNNTVTLNDQLALRSLSDGFAQRRACFRRHGVYLGV